MGRKNNDAFKNVLTELVMDVFAQNINLTFNYKQVSAKLNIDDNSTRQLIHQIITENVKKGLLKEVETGKYQGSTPKNYLIGTVDVTQSGSAYLIVEGLEEDVFIAPRKLRNALNGDVVKVFVYAKRNGKHMEGEVLEIIERARTEFTGIVKVSSRFAFLIPDNRKMQHDLFIPLEGLKGAKDGDKALVKMVEWPAGAKNPIGEVMSVLGRQGENETEMNAILADYGFPLHFPQNVIAESEAILDTISKEEIKKRRDFRDILTFTIDPADAKDFDDAISFQFLENGNYEIGVHIADVSHYVHTETALNEEAFERATSVYLVDRVIPMLPEKLSNGLCSLRPNEDKLTFSAVFELDKNAKVITEWFGRTIIHSKRRFAYEEAQQVLETKEGDCKEELLILNDLAYKLRAARFKKGAISFETTEVKFKLGENGRPIGVYVKERKDAHKLIEDFMLLANRKVAEFIATKGTKHDRLAFVYRVHDEPDEAVIGNFARFAARFGYKINTKTQKDITNSLNSMMTEVEGKKEQNVLTQLAIRAMAKAIYTTKKSSHYGLAFDYYTHFTSPIRRYPDVMVHRLLQYYLDGGKSADAEGLEQQCLHTSQMEKKAADAERASIKYKQAEFLQDHIGQEFVGLISGVTEWGIYVEISENKCEGMVRLRDITDDFYVLDPENYCIIGQRKKHKYQLGDEVKIEVKKVDLVKRQIDFKLIS